MLETRKHLPTLNQEMAVTIGQQLKATRMGRGLTLQQAADPLLLSVRQIECLEAGDSSLFYGARLYAQAADKYATFLHIDVMPSQMMLDYQSDSVAGQATPAATTPTPAPKAAPSTQHTVPPVVAMPETVPLNAIPAEPIDTHTEYDFDAPVTATEPTVAETSVETAEAKAAPAPQPAQTIAPTALQQPHAAPTNSLLKTAVTVTLTAAVTAAVVLNIPQLESVLREQMDDLPSIAELSERFRSAPVEAPAAAPTKEASEPPAKVVEAEPEKAPVANEPEATKPESLKPAPMPMVSSTLTVSTENPVAEKPAPRNVNFAVTDKTGLITIRFGVDSWVQAVTKSGKQRIERTYNEGDTLTLQPSNLQSLTIGNSSQVKVTADGNKLDLTPYSKGSVARFSTEQLEALGSPRSAEPPIPAKQVSPTSKATETNAEQDKNMLASE